MSSRFSPGRSATLACHRASDANQSAAWLLTSTLTVEVAGAWPDSATVAVSEKRKPSRLAKPLATVSSRGMRDSTNAQRLAANDLSRSISASGR